MPRALRELLLPVALGALCILVLFVVVLPPSLRDLGAVSRGANFDFQSYFLPKYIFGTEELLRGRLPAWNIYEYAGLPFIATMQPAVFYPPKLLFYALLPGVTAHWVFLIFHYLLGLLGFGLFCRELGLRREAAFVGAVVFLFAMPTLTANYHPTRIACLSWIPFLFLFATRVLRGGGLRSFAALSACVGLQLHAGYPEFTLDAGLFVAVYVFATWIAELPKRPRWSAPFIIGAAFLLGALTAAIDLLPLVEASVESKRSTAVANLLTPDDKSLKVAIWTLYGLSVPGLVAFAPLSLSTRRGWPAFLTLLAALALLSFGELLTLLPWFPLIRFPYILLMVILFVPAWAAALGVDAFLSAADAPPLRKWLLASCVIAGGAWLLVVYAGRLVGEYRNRGLPYDHESTVLSLVGLTLVITSAVALVRRLPAGALLLGAGLVLVTSQFAAHPFHLPPGPFERPGPVGEIKRLLGNRPPPQGRAFSMHDILHGYNLTDRIPSVLGIEESFLPARFQKIRLRLRLTHIVGFINLRMFADMRGFLDAMDLEYFAVKPTDVFVLGARGFVPVARDSRAVLFHNPQRMGPAWVNYAVRRVASEDAAYEYIVSKEFDPHLEVVVSEQEVQSDYFERGQHAVTPARSVRRPSPTELEVDVELPRPGVLVVSEAAYPGWTATVNGKPVHWVHANYVLRGVELEPGAHKVRFEYRSPALRWGTLITCVAVVVVAACGLIGQRRSRSRARR